MQRKPLPILIWVLIIGTAITRSVFFMIFPFLAIYLKNKMNVNVATIGWIIGVGPLAGIFTGFYGGYLSDIFGRRRILLSTLLVWSVVLGLFAVANTVWSFAVLSALNGMLRAISEPVIQAVISDKTSEEQRKRAYHYRYLSINVGAVIGPVVGAWLLIKFPALGFILSGISMAIFGIVYGLMTRHLKQGKMSSEEVPGVMETLGILFKDIPLLYYVGASILGAIAYTQMDTVMPLSLDELMGERGVKLYGWVMMTNGLTIVTCQLPLNKLTNRFNIIHTVAAGCLVFGLGYIGFGFSGEMFWAYIVSMYVLSLGEALVFSNGFILIDQLAPDHLRGTYHSAANLFAVGTAAGPILGTWVYGMTDERVLYFASAGLLVICGLMYLQGGRSR